MIDDAADPMRGFQQSGFSYPFRIMEDLAALVGLRAALGLPPPAKVLVFGCSGGDEVLTVKAVLPGAACTACDVADEALRMSRFALRMDGVEVVASDWADLAARGPYDVITANAVFCWHPQDVKLDDLSAVLPFAAFDDAVQRLTAMLTPGGALLMGDLNYPAGLTAAADDLVPVSLRNAAWHGAVERYAADGLKFAQRVLTPRLAAFQGFRQVRDLPLPFEPALMDRAWLRRPLPKAGSRLEVRWPVPAAWSGLPEAGTFVRDLAAELPAMDGVFGHRTTVTVLQHADGAARLVRRDSLSMPKGAPVACWEQPVRAARALARTAGPDAVLPPPTFWRTGDDSAVTVPIIAP